MTTLPPPRIAALVLAAGRSTRMGPDHKLLLQDASGLAMAASVAAACSASQADWLIVVTGHQADRVTQAMRTIRLRADARFVYAPDHETGLSASLRAGLAALPAQADGVLVCLADMPHVGPATMDRLIAASGPGRASDAVVPVWQGRRGNPVLWNRRCFAVLAGLSGDTGGRQLLQGAGTVVHEVPVDSPGVLTDCDTPEQAHAAGYMCCAGA